MDFFADVLQEFPKMSHKYWRKNVKIFKNSINIIKCEAIVPFNLSEKNESLKLKVSKVGIEKPLLEAACGALKNFCGDRLAKHLDSRYFKFICE